MISKNLVIEQWKFRKKEDMDWLPATVPGCVHTDLLKNGKINDPFYGKNELDLQWIDKEDWEYQTEFDISDEMLKQDNIELVFDGLDTYADVYLNDELILSTNNMFRAWKVDVKNEMKQKNNWLRVYFHSPIKTDLVKLDQIGYGLPAANDHSEDGGLGDKKLSVFARKAPYHYGWDWGPRFVTSGIWRDVRVESWSTCHITDMYIQQKIVTTENAELTAIVEVQADKEMEIELQLATDGLQLAKKTSLIKGTNQIEIDIEIEEPKLWWSRGLGKQNFYHFTAKLIESSQFIAEKSVRTGLRSIKLVRENNDKGTSFYFELNGVPVFAKGANHIPNDSFLTDVTYERYRHEIASAAEANMNMLRVWGGGIYEDDAFYDLCDEYGILVWQDFMFACSMYPGNQEFLDSVKEEAVGNIKRLRNHPSIALWCGNNEIDAAWAHYNDNMGWGWKEKYTVETREKIWNDYERIFHQILPEVVTAHMPEIAYWPSSPLNDLSGTISQHSESTTSTSGDIHYWHVWHSRKPIEEYKKAIGRFMSEYGFQSFPELKTVKTYAEKEDMEIDSKIMLHHQKNGAGNRLIKEYMNDYYNEPKDFPSFIYMSHVLQAFAIETAIEAHRVNKPYCMGTLYWQMNDCWPVASWASIDYYGRWKALQYTAKRSFNDVLLTVDQTDNQLKIHLVTDILDEVSGNLLIRLYDFNGKLLAEDHSDVEVKPNSSTLVKSLEKVDFLANYKANEVVVYAQLQRNGDIIASKEFFLESMKNITLPKPNITFEEKEDSNGTEFIISTDALAKSVWLDVDVEGVFSDNYFDLIPGISKTVTFLARDDEGEVFVPAKPDKLTVQSMIDFIK